MGVATGARGGAPCGRDGERALPWRVEAERARAGTKAIMRLPEGRVGNERWGRRGKE